MEPKACSFRSTHRCGSVVSAVIVFAFVGFAEKVVSGSLPLDIERQLAEIGLTNGDFDATNQYANWNCTVTLSENMVRIGASGGSRAIKVNFAGVCDWDAEVNSISWLRVGTNKTSTGESTLTYMILPNDTSSERIAALTIATKVLTITQAGKHAAYAGRISR